MGIELCAADLLDPLDAEGDDCFNANWMLIADIRGIMVSAGIRDQRILGKLCMNDPLVMTPKQCCRIADCLQRWLDDYEHTALHWDQAMLSEYHERQQAKPQRKRPTPISLRDDELDACFHEHPVTDEDLLEAVADFAAFCRRMSQRAGFVVN